MSPRLALILSRLLAHRAALRRPTGSGAVVVLEVGR